MSATSSSLLPTTPVSSDSSMQLLMTLPSSRSSPSRLPSMKYCFWLALMGHTGLLGRNILRFLFMPDWRAWSRAFTKRALDSLDSVILSCACALGLLLFSVVLPSMNFFSEVATESISFSLRGSPGAASLFFQSLRTWAELY